MHSNFRVLRDAGNHYFVCDETGAGELRAELAGRFYDPEAGLGRPVVGDWVRGRREPGDWVYIEEVRERRTLLRRRVGRDTQNLAANVDLVVVMTSMNGDLNPRRLDRYRLLVAEAGAALVIAVNKCDLVLAEEKRSVLESLGPRLPGAEVHGLSLVTGEGLSALRDRLAVVTGAGGTLAFIGSSGVGKSTLANELLGGEGRLRTGEIREDDDRGRHTTTHRELRRLRDGGWLMDTPGLRGLVPEFGGDEISDVFGDFAEVARACRFRDCGHAGEPGCAVAAALASGTLSAERWDSYRKMKKEDEREAILGDPVRRKEREKVWKSISMGQRARRKAKSRNGW